MANLDMQISFWFISDRKQKLKLSTTLRNTFIIIFSQVEGYAHFYSPMHFRTSNAIRNGAK